MLGAKKVSVGVLITVSSFSFSAGTDFSAFVDKSKNYVTSPEFLVGVVVGPIARHYGKVIIEEGYYCLVASKEEREEREERRRVDFERKKLENIVTKRTLLHEHKAELEDASSEERPALQKEHDAMLSAYTRALGTVF